MFLFPQLLFVPEKKFIVENSENERQNVYYHVPSTLQHLYVYLRLWFENRLSFINIHFSKVCFSRFYIFQAFLDINSNNNRSSSGNKKIRMDLQFKQLLRFEYTLCFVSNSLPVCWTLPASNRFHPIRNVHSIKWFITTAAASATATKRNNETLCKMYKYLPFHVIFKSNKESNGECMMWYIHGCQC